MLLALGGVGLAVVGWRHLGAVARAYLLALAAGFVLFGATVRWQPFNARLHLPLLVLAAPGIGLALGRLGRMGLAVAACMVAAAVPALLMNATRPVVVPPGGGTAMTDVESVFVAPRPDQYFASRRDGLTAFAHLATAARGIPCDRFVIKTGYDGWEYPLWRMLGAARFDHVFVQNASTELGEIAIEPGWCLVTVDTPPDWRPPADGPALDPVWTEGPVALWHAR